MEQNIQAKFSKKQNYIRMAIMDFIIDQKKAYDIYGEDYRCLKNVNEQPGDIRQIIQEIRAKDGLVLDDSGLIHFIYPVSAQPTNHVVHLADGREFTAMCAIDAIGAAFTFHQDTEVKSSCSVCGADLFVKIADGILVDCTSKEIHVLTFDLEKIENWAASC